MSEEQQVSTTPESAGEAAAPSLLDQLIDSARFIHEL